MNAPTRPRLCKTGQRYGSPLSFHSLSLRPRISHSKTRIHVRLLGPCFKTGRMIPFHQRERRTTPLPASRVAPPLLAQTEKPPADPSKRSPRPLEGRALFYQTPEIPEKEPVSPRKANPPKHLAPSLVNPQNSTLIRPRKA